MPNFEQATFTLERNNEGDLRIMWTGIEGYAGLLKKTFPNVRFSAVFKDRFGNYSFGIFAKGISSENETLVKAFCRLVSNAIWIVDELDECFALSLHGTYPRGQFHRTPMGDLVHDAKPYHKPVTESNKAHAKVIASLMASFIEDCPVYKSADALAAVPSNPDKPFDLPTYIVAETARLTKKSDVSSAIHKTRRTQPMKDYQSNAEKAANIRGAFWANPSVLSGKKIILLDDIYDSGQSINEAGRIVQGAGALTILGLTVTKTQPRQ